jgi:regulator of protease activity HflC (stomatin/prohibitin superfamily)
MVAQKTTQQPTFPFKWLFVAIVAIVIISIALMTIKVVPAGHRGVLLTFGAVSDTLGEGLHIITPIKDNIIMMDVRTQKFETVADSASKDLQSIQATIALNYHIDPGQASEIYRQLGREFQGRIITPAIEESVKASTAKFTAEELITKREEVNTIIKDKLRERLSTFGLYVDAVSVVDFQFSQQFDEAIEAAETAKRRAIEAKNYLEQVKFEADQARSKAQGEADAILAIAEAEAKAIELQAKALKENPQLVQLELAKRWNGQLPLYSFGESGSVFPFMSIPALTSYPTPQVSSGGTVVG